MLAARREALAADLVVVNHHLFFADVMLRDEGTAELLPACNTVISVSYTHLDVYKRQGVRFSAESATLGRFAISPTFRRTPCQ